LPKTLPLTPFKDDIFVSYLYSKLFKREGDENRCGLSKGWVTELVETPQKPRYKSWDALAAIVFGQAHKSDEVIENAHVLYGHALSELRKKLSGSDDWRTDSILASMTALSIYEVSHHSLCPRIPLTILDTKFQVRPKLDAACQWAWVFFGVERTVAEDPARWGSNISGASYYTSKTFLN
jgi:hypothetical protein